MKTRGLIVLALSGLAPAALADVWQMALTADNQFALYVGNAERTTALVGTGTSWATTWVFTSDQPDNRHLYIVSASDRVQAQGLIGVFRNETTNRTIITDANWKVFPAGAYAATNPSYPAPWPANLMPTQQEVDDAIEYATANNLWVPVATCVDFVNGVSPWGFRPNIPPEAAWIWHYAGHRGACPAPFLGSVNHDEFLVFRMYGGGGTCYSNCDESTTEPILNVNDFICFQAKFAAGDSYANCDQSTIAPVLNVNDFICFQTRFAAGCR